MIINIFSGKEQKLCRETFRFFAFNLTHKSTKVYLDANTKRKGKENMSLSITKFHDNHDILLGKKFVESSLKTFFPFHFQNDYDVFYSTNFFLLKRYLSNLFDFQLNFNDAKVFLSCFHLIKKSLQARTDPLDGDREAKKNQFVSFIILLRKKMAKSATKKSKTFVLNRRKKKAQKFLNNLRDR
jgi:hypothetical protein